MIDLQNEDGKTALHFSVLEQHHVITKLLLDAGADPRIEDGDADTAVDLAIYSGNDDSIRMLEVCRCVEAPHALLFGQALMSCRIYAFSFSSSHRSPHLYLCFPRILTSHRLLLLSLNEPNVFTRLGY